MTPVLRAVEHSPAGRVAARGSPDDDALLRLGAWLHRTGYRFVTVTPATHARVNVRQSAGDAKSLQDVFAWSRPFRPSLLPREALAWLQKGDGLEYASGQLRSKVRFSRLGDSLYMHSAYPTASSDAVFFGPGTYRFTALIKRTLAAAGRPRAGCVVDVGCGAAATAGAATAAGVNSDGDDGPMGYFVDSLFRKNPGAAAGDPPAAASAATMPGGAAEPPATASSLEIPAHLSSTSAATPKPAPASFPIRCDVFMGIPSDLS